MYKIVSARPQRTAAQPSSLSMSTMREGEYDLHEGNAHYDDPSRGNVREGNHHRASTPSLDNATSVPASPAISPIQQSTVAAPGTGFATIFPRPLVVLSAFYLFLFSQTIALSAFFIGSKVQRLVEQSWSPKYRARVFVFRHGHVVCAEI